MAHYSVEIETPGNDPRKVINLKDAVPGSNQKYLLSFGLSRTRVA